MSEAYRSVPVFEDQEVDMFFQYFERVAKRLNWPQSKRTLLAVSRFKGKASLAYNSMSDERASQYDLVKSAVLRAYELRHEDCRLWHSELKKTHSQSYSEFVAKKSGCLING